MSELGFAAQSNPLYPCGSKASLLGLAGCPDIVRLLTPDKEQRDAHGRQRLTAGASLLPPRQMSQQSVLPPPAVAETQGPISVGDRLAPSLECLHQELPGRENGEKRKQENDPTSPIEQHVANDR